MSIEKSVTITCPGCKTQSPFTIWSSVNTMLSPEMKPAILDGSAFLFTCPHCGMKNNINYDLLYHQMEDHIMIQYATSDEYANQFMDTMSGKSPIKELQSMVDDMVQQHYLIRIVRSLNQLREKIAILDAGLDDRIVEIYKLLIQSTYHEQHPDAPLPEVLFSANPEQREFYLYADSKYAGTANLADDLYDEIKSNYQKLLPDLRDDGYFIDHQWALNFFSQLSEEK